MGIEGTGSYGAGIARFLTGRGYSVIEVNRPDRSTRYRKGKSDPTDAEMAARAILAGIADAIPKSGQGEVEMIRMLKSTKDSAVKARTQAINQMKAMIVTASARLRESLDGLSVNDLVARCRNFRIGHLRDPLSAAKYALRSLACRYHQLTDEIRSLKAELTRLIGTASPTLLDIVGVGPAPRRPFSPPLVATRSASIPRPPLPRYVGCVRYPRPPARPTDTGLTEVATARPIRLSTASS